MKIHICVITSVHQIFDGRIFHRQCKSLAKAGYKVTLIGPADFKTRVIDNISIVGIPKSNNRFGRLLIWWKIFCLTSSIKPDIVHLHDPELLVLVPLLRFTIQLKLRIIYDVHEFFVDSLMDKHWIPKPIRPVVGRFAKIFEQLFANKVDGIICAVKGQLILYKLFQGPICVVRNLPLAHLFQNASPHPALNVAGFKLIYVGIIVPERGIEIILEAMHLLHRQGYKDIYLFLIGPESTQAYVNQLESLAQSFELNDKVQWLGYIPHDKLKHYLKNADAGLNPGLSTPQFNNPSIGTKLFEYMLCGLPIISVDQPHHRIYIDECQGGRLVPIEDSSSHADAIMWLRNHPKLAREMGNRGRKMVLENYTWEKEESRMLTFYQAVQNFSHNEIQQQNERG